MGADLDPLSMVSMHTSTANHSSQGFPTSAHRTVLAGFPHPALGRASRRSMRKRPQMDAPEMEDPQLPEDDFSREGRCPARRDLVSSPQEVPHPVRHILIHRPVRHQPRPIGGGGPTPQHSSVRFIGVGSPCLPFFPSEKEKGAFRGWTCTGVLTRACEPSCASISLCV